MTNLWRGVVASSAAVWLGLYVGCESHAESRGEDSSHLEDAQSVSIIQLIALPERFEGKRVRLIGFARLMFEEQSLYLHREDSEMFNTRNAVWLDTTRRPEQLDASFVIVEGMFTAGDHGHLGLWPGSITKITRLDKTTGRSVTR